MSIVVPVPLGARSYDIHVGTGLLKEAGRMLARGPLPVVTDETVARLHLPALMESLAAAGIDARPIVLPPGEGTKSFAWLEKLCRELLRLGVERGGTVVAFGGGVIGDLVGFAAGVLKRGVDFVQIPTTLLAQVDSSVGGKTAIDVPEGKNLIGLFHQPKMVLADVSLLATLSRREVLSGYAEVVKYGALGDAGFFRWLETNGMAALGGDDALLAEVVAHCCRMKAEIVSRDERESGERALLNLGHTFGHALEASLGYGDVLLHGEAVAVGMALAFRLSVALGFASVADMERLVAHLRAVGLRTELRELAPVPDPDTLLGFMRHDKKAREGRLRLVLARAIGEAFLSSDVDPGAVRAVLAP